MSQAQPNDDDAISSQILKLEQARLLVLADPTHYNAIIPGILPILDPNGPIELRRWGADFLAEAFANPALAAASKESLGVKVIPTLKTLLESGNDEVVIKAVIQTMASIYGSVFRFVARRRNEGLVWQDTVAIKSNILRRWESPSMGVRMCCIKFVQRVIQVQTTGPIADPRRPEMNEISLAILPRDHPVLQQMQLEAESSGLLDRLLSIFQDNPSASILVDATLNCLSALVRSRPPIAPKIISSVLNYNPWSAWPIPLSPRDRMLFKSVEKTTRAFLINLLKSQSAGAFAPKVKAYIDKLMAKRLEVANEVSKKRGPPEPTDGLDSAKRARLGAEVPEVMPIPPLPDLPISLAQLFTLNPEEALKSFSVTNLPQNIMLDIIIPIMQAISPERLQAAITGIDRRWLAVSSQRPSAQALDVPADDEDEYEPNFEPAEATEQVLNDIDAASGGELELSDQANEDDITLSQFYLPQPPPLTSSEAVQLAETTITRVFNMFDQSPASPSRAPTVGLSRSASAQFDKDTWLTLITRLATRTLIPYTPPPSTSIDPSTSSPSNTDETSVIPTSNTLSTNTIGDSIRTLLLRHIMADFRARLPLSISWLSEEWYAERTLLKSTSPSTVLKNGRLPLSTPTPTYEKWVLRLFDAISPYIDSRDKQVIVWVSELPSLPKSVFAKITSLARDPDRIPLVVRLLSYLIMFRPPVKEMALDSLEELWRTVEEARSETKKVLIKYRSELFKDEITAKKAKAEVPVASGPVTDVDTKVQVPAVEAAS